MADNIFDKEQAETASYENEVATSRDDRGKLDLTRQIGELQCENAGLVNKYNKEHKLRQEAEGEMTILKTISVHSSPEMKVAKEKIQELKKEIEELKYDNHQLSKQIEDQVDRARKAGL